MARSHGVYCHDIAIAQYSCIAYMREWQGIGNRK